MKHRAGFAAILGKPNAGKSTLLNAMTGAKLAIVASRPQTTRTSIQGVVTLPEAQIVFVDTPGIHKSSTLLNKRMMDSVRATADGLDVALFLVDTLAPYSDEDAQAVDLVKKSAAPAIAVFNKVDQLKDKTRVLRLIERYQALHDFAAYIPISAMTGDGLAVLQKEIIRLLPEGPALYPEDYLTDQPERFLAAEILREKVLRLTRQEVPHAVAVVIESWEEAQTGAADRSRGSKTAPASKRARKAPTPSKHPAGTPLLRIAATIYVERPGQKAILIGSGGEGLKKIGMLARQEMERAFGRKVFLQTFVKVRAGWREDPEFIGATDWRATAGF